MPSQTLYLAVQGARTRKGGVVRVKSPAVGEPGMPVAMVGDEVLYPDGSVASITSGAGMAMLFHGQPVALVGSDVSGGDRIISSPDNGVRIGLVEGQSIEGLFDPHYAAQTESVPRG